ncbi:hypothetical protein HanIR_Chr10g0471711 [Helianthus annuus]|nr:hypothetical protein HanIR_Chr10g0471711 [Helianthus annuus]
MGRIPGLFLFGVNDVINSWKFVSGSKKDRCMVSLVAEGSPFPVHDPATIPGGKYPCQLDWIEEPGVPRIRTHLHVMGKKWVKKVEKSG